MLGMAAEVVGEDERGDEEDELLNEFLGCETGGSESSKWRMEGSMMCLCALSSDTARGSQERMAVCPLFLD